jgi:hypothetical protein
MVENCDSQIFVSIPALAVLYGLESIVKRFAPTIFSSGLWSEIQREVKKNSKQSAIELEVLELSDTGLPIA